MVVLFVTYDVDHLVDREVLETQLCRTNVLRHIDARAVSAEQQLLIKSVLCQVSPYRAVLLTEEESLAEALFYGLLTYQISVAFVIDLVEANSECFISLVKTFVHPFVHLAPQSTYLRVVGLPLHEHRVCLLHKGAFLFSFSLSIFFIHTFGHKLGLQLLHLSAVVLIEGYVIVANQVVALLAAAFRSLAVAVLEPCQHRLTDVDTTIVDNVRLHDAVAVSLYYASQGPTQ